MAMARCRIWGLPPSPSQEAPLSTPAVWIIFRWDDDCDDQVVPRPGDWRGGSRGKTNTFEASFHCLHDWWGIKSPSWSSSSPSVPTSHLIIIIIITILIISQAVSSGLTCRPQQDLVRPFLLEGLLLCQEGISAFTNINPHIIKPLFNFSKYFIAKLKTKSPVLALGEVHL